jgi:hypothetical protein
LLLTAEVAEEGAEIAEGNEPLCELRAFLRDLCG